MESDETESRLDSVQQNLLADMEAMQGALPDNGEETSEALERSARIVTGPADPPGTYWQEEDIVLSPMGGTFTNGRIAVAVHFIDLPPPSLS